ncbi:putative sterile alpha and TIR motif-containing protein [Plasmopara halstedii]
MPPPQTLIIDIHPSAYSKQSHSFPTPFKCSGEFCNFGLQLSQENGHQDGRRAVVPPKTAAASALALLFTKHELDAFGDVHLDRLLVAMEVAQSTRINTEEINHQEMRVITYKNIALSRKNREHWQKTIRNSGYLQSVTEISTFPIQIGRRRQSRFLENTLSQELRENSRSRGYGEVDHVASYYRQVRVCERCYAVYTLLDLARQLTLGTLEADEKVVVQQQKQHLKRKRRLINHQRNRIKSKLKEQVALNFRDKNRKTRRKKYELLPVSELSEHSDDVDDAGSSLILPALVSSGNTAINQADLGKTNQAKLASQHTVTMPSIQATALPRSDTKPPSTFSLGQSREKKLLLQTNETCKGIDNYLRGVTKFIKAPSLEPGQFFRKELTANRSTTADRLAIALSLLLISSDTALLDDMHRMLQSLKSSTIALEIESMTNGRLALRVAQDFDYDVILIERQLGGDDLNGLEFCRLLRQSQLKSSLHRHAFSTVICISSELTPNDLQLYKDSGMDGCIGKPIDSALLLRMLRAAPQIHNTRFSCQRSSLSSLEFEKAKDKRRRRQQRHQNRLEISQALTMPGLDGKVDARDDVIHGIFHMDAETAIPFCVMGGTRTTISDLDTDLNSAAAIDYTLFWPRSSALVELSGWQTIITRQAVSFNWNWQRYFTHVDPQLAQFLHDTAKVLTCTPESRPDLPVFFHARYLFSNAYLARVSTPLALNLYTAVVNPITLDGRRALTTGALAHNDLRPDLQHLKVPLISICSTQNKLLNAAEHTETLMSLANLELVDSIGKVLRYRGRNKRPTCVLWLPSGHEALQECKQDILVLLEQLVTGFHEINDISLGTRRNIPNHSPSKVLSRCEDAPPQRRASDTYQYKKKGKTQPRFEDAFFDRVLTTVKDAVPICESVSNKVQPDVEEILDGTKWRHHQQQLVLASPESDRKYQTRVHGHLLSNKCKPSKLTSLMNWDPLVPAFERTSTNVIYQPGGGSKIYSLSPDVKEYMGWRVRRNQKRLQRMASMARVIQRAFRAFSARTLIWRLHREKCAINLQRLCRAQIARKHFKVLKCENQAVRLLQRHWRGKIGRSLYKQRMLKFLASLHLQRIARGWRARRSVQRHRQLMHRASLGVQQLIIRYQARKRLLKQRNERNAATNIQRVFRGLLGRRRFSRERDKFLFSNAQIHGLTFGKQLLLEYKLQSTKLQSDVALLAREKSDVENQVEKLIQEICEFDESVRRLETELLALGKTETDDSAPGGVIRVLDETAKWALREQKIRLDRDFSQMLAQIEQRRGLLGTLEKTLSRIDRERLWKEEELKALERKLVMLLDEQQKELTRIRSKQDSRSQIALDLLASKSDTTSPDYGSTLANGMSTLSSTSTVLSEKPSPAPSVTPQQRQEAAALMESTETMMKFGFMSMSMTYFSSMNMVRAMRKIGAHHLALDSVAAISQQQWPENPAADLQSNAPASVGAALKPSIPLGASPGQPPLQVAAWSVNDVGRWLETLVLAQYKRAFADASVDGALLLHLTDDDLRNTLGMEHRLHRKKVLTMVEEIRVRERKKMQQIAVDSPVATLKSDEPFSKIPIQAPAMTNAIPSLPLPSVSSIDPLQESAGASVAGGRVAVSFNDFCSLVRHGKSREIREALQEFVEQKFDPLTVKTPFVPGSGTIYIDQLEKSEFHMNKSDTNGNSLLLLATQNNHLKVVQLLLSKGANPDHQNNHGHTAGHYAMAYSFFDVGAWLLDPDKGGGRDDILNENGLNAYDETMTTWKWLMTKRNNGILAALESPNAVPASANMPVAICRVVFVMELVLVSSAAFLLVVSSSIFGSIVRNLLGEIVIFHICETAALGWGLVILIAKFLQLPRMNIVRHFTRFRWSSLRTCFASLQLHFLALVAINLWGQDQGLLYWRNVNAAVHQADGSIAIDEIVQILILAPIKEELLFRGMIMLVAINRLQNLKSSALLSSFLFATVHLINARHIGSQYSASYVAFQIFWAWLVGLFLALNLAITGSLMECIILHIINNIFALGVSKISAIDITQPSLCCLVLAALIVYSVAIARQLHLLNDVKLATK